MNARPCPTCKKPVEYSPDNQWRPFCCERCKLIDLGDWASGKNAIACAEATEMSDELQPTQGNR